MNTTEISHLKISVYTLKISILLIIKSLHIVGWGADMSLARPRRKQATANKLVIYSTYPPRSAIHFLAPCTTFGKPLKKNQNISVQPGPRGSNDLRFGRKMTTFQLFFQSREQVLVRRSQIRRLGWVIKTLQA